MQSAMLLLPVSMSSWYVSRHLLLNVSELTSSVSQPPKLDFVEQIAFKAAGDVFYNILRPALTGREVDALAFINSKLPLESADFVKKGSVEEGEAEEVDEDEIEDGDVDDIIDAYLDSFSSEQEFEQLKPSTSASAPIQWFGNSTVSPATPVKNKITTTASAPHKWIGNSTISPATPIKKAPISRLWSATTATPPRTTRRNKENIKVSTASKDMKSIKRARRVTPPFMLEMMLNNSLVQ
ncbi:hypothetical protein VNI00_003857 [Paramarasmius palmivorus]|uniref:Uncharacterized protein n=1 Tax=Paramarasmius palmivorus TaxID=297713 RepID=A0AAW0DKK4_9AGAR